MPESHPTPDRAKLRWFVTGLLAISALMFFSIILKTMLQGP